MIILNYTANFKKSRKTRKDKGKKRGLKKAALLGALGVATIGGGLYLKKKLPIVNAGINRANKGTEQYGDYNPRSKYRKKPSKTHLVHTNEAQEFATQQGVKYIKGEGPKRIYALNSNKATNIHNASKKIESMTSTQLANRFRADVTDPYRGHVGSLKSQRQKKASRDKKTR